MYCSAIYRRITNPLCRPHPDVLENLKFKINITSLAQTMTNFDSKYNHLFAQKKKIKIKICFFPSSSLSSLSPSTRKMTNEETLKMSFTCLNSYSKWFHKQFYYKIGEIYWEKKNNNNHSKYDRTGRHSTNDGIIHGKNKTTVIAYDVRKEQKKKRCCLLASLLCAIFLNI